MSLGAIFDLDGTILDSMGMWAHADGDFVRSQGLVPPPGLHELLEPLGISEAAVYFHEVLGMPGTPDSIRASFLDFVGEAYRKKLLLKAGSGAYLRRLRQEGVTICLLSATETMLSRAALDRLEVLPLFDHVLCCTDLGHSKSSPLAFQIALELMGTTVHETVVFEDALYAIETAKTMGLAVAAVSEPENARDDGAIRDLADLYIHHYDNCPGVAEILRNLSVPLEICD